MYIFVNLIAMVFFMICSAFFSGSETAFSALTKAQIYRIRKDKKKGSNYILQFIDNPSRLFITVLFGNILVNIAFISITSSMVYNYLFKGKNLVLASFTAIGIELVILLFIGEITPKSIALRHAERISRIAARPLWLFAQLILPFRKILRMFTDLILPLFGVKSAIPTHNLSSDELKDKVKKAKEHGAINEQEEGIIANIFDLYDIEAKEVMIPRNEMVCIKVTNSVKDAFEKAKSKRFSRIPVFRKNLDSICGIFNVKDYNQWKGKRIGQHSEKTVEQLTIEEFISLRGQLENMYPGEDNTLVRLPFFSVDSKKIGHLIRTMTNRKRRLSILLDEYGGVAGLITVRDIVDEVLGDLLSSDNIIDGHAIMYDSKNGVSFSLSGLAGLRSMKRKFNWDVNLSRAETLGGYVMELFDSIPEKGYKMYDKKNNIEFEVLAMDGNRIKELKIKQMKSDA